MILNYVEDQFEKEGTNKRRKKLVDEKKQREVVRYKMNFKII